MRDLQSFLGGRWVPGVGDPVSLRNPATTSVLATTRGVQGLGSALRYARDVGGPALRALSFPERAARLDAMVKRLHGARDELLTLSIESGGNTRGDAKFDVDGGLAVLAAYAELGRTFGSTPWLPDDDAVALVPTGKIRAQHILVPRHGVAIHVNAFNFPAWGLLGKLAVAFLAGVPVVTKPATSTSLVAHRIVELLLEGEPDLVPTGALSLVMGPVRDLFDEVSPQDVIAFTGSAETARTIRQHERVALHNVRLNLEADSLNAAVIGPDVTSGTLLFDLIVKDAAIEMTQKAGQKCTATRRLLVPKALLGDLRDALAERLSRTVIGDPAQDNVRMGPLATASQLHDGRDGLARLCTHARRVYGDPARTSFTGVEPGQGYFLEPIVLEADLDAARSTEAPFHHTEVFGPVCTLLPYDGGIEAIRPIVAAGQGALVTTLYSDDRDLVAQGVAELSPYTGRLVLANEKVAGASISPGCVFPQVNHGGPGRAGGGQELGGRGGLALYLQRTTVQGGAAQLKGLFE